MQTKLDRLRREFDNLGVQGVLISNPYNRRYLTDFSGTYGHVVISKNANILITDSRYTQQASTQCKGFEIVKQEKDIFKTIYDVLKRLGVTDIGIEENYVTLQQYNNYKDNFRDINLLPIKGTIQKLREIKYDEEVSKVRKAAQIADAAFSHILEIIKPGITEAEIALELEFYMKKNGASALSFDTIAASGERSSMPHGTATDKIIQYGDTLTLDFGCVFEGYCSDMTRTVFVGKADERMKEVYQIVLEAQEKALKILKPGLTGKDVDKEARKVITEKGYGENFGHALGHSVGLEVHEEPGLSSKNENILQPGMLLTVEPGIYLEGIGGVRIEDLALLTEKGCENLVTSPKELIIL